MALSDTLVVLLTAGLPFLFARLFVTRFLFRGYEVRGAAVKFLFSLTFTLSVDALLLAIFEIVGILDPGVRWLTWKIVLGLLVVVLVVVLPVAFVLLVAGENGLRPRSARFLSVLVEGAFLYLFWWLGSFFPIVEHGQHDVLSFEGSIGRLGVAGVTAAAILSGYGAVATPHSYLSALLHTVRERDVRSKKRAVREHLARLLELQGREAREEAERRGTQGAARDGGGLAASTTPSTTPSASWQPAARLDDETATPPFPSSSSSSSSSSSFPAAPRSSPPSPSRSWPLPLPSWLPGSSSVAPADADLAPLLAAQIDATSALHREAFAEYTELLNAKRRQDWSKHTVQGRTMTALGYGLSVYAVYKMCMAFVNLVFSRDPTKDPVTQGFELLLVFFRVPRDEAGLWVQPVSFAFVGTLVFTSVRGFLLSFSQLVASFSSRLGLSSVTSSSVVLLLAQVMGMYFVSVLLLLRMSMPEEYREGVTRAIGPVHFKFFHRYFDFIFFLSACVSVIAFVAVTAVRAARMKVTEADRLAESAMGMGGWGSGGGGGGGGGGRTGRRAVGANASGEDWRGDGGHQQQRPFLPSSDATARDGGLPVVPLASLLASSSPDVASPTIGLLLREGGRSLPSASSVGVGAAVVGGGGGEDDKQRALLFGGRGSRGGVALGAAGPLPLPRDGGGGNGGTGLITSAGVGPRPARRPYRPPAPSASSTDTESISSGVAGRDDPQRDNVPSFMQQQFAAGASSASLRQGGGGKSGGWRGGGDV
jgi:golgi pH regulator